MVCARMGMLDDAIREHLELKRLRGADPVEVAREEHEALDPVPRDERASPDLDLEGVEEQPGGAPEAAGDLESSDDLRETAELDMRTLLDEDQRPPDAPAPSGSTHDEPEAPDEEDSLEWEFPGDSATGAAAHRGDLEHGSGRGDPAGTIGKRVPLPLLPGPAAGPPTAAGPLSISLPLAALIWRTCGAA